MPRSFASVAAGILIVIMIGGAAALAPHERGRERIGEDEDPIILPAFAAVPGIGGATAQDPETTGSIAASSWALCDRVAFYPQNPPEKQFREAC